MNIKSNKLVFAGVGELLWDLLPQGKQLGGAPANFSYHLRQLGAESYIISAVGDDILGHEIIQYLQKLRLSTDFITMNSDHVSGTVEIEIDDAGVPEYIIHENVAWDYIPHCEKTNELISKTDAICFGSLAQRSEMSAKTIRTILETSPENCFKIYDINIRQSFYSQNLIAENLFIANGFKLNEDEIQLIADMFAFSGTEEIIIHKLMNKFDLDLITVTKGGNGSSIYTCNDQSYRISPNIDVVDTVGAGDAFTAGLVFAYLNDYSLAAAHDFANILAAYVCTQKGAMPKYSEELIQDLLKIDKSS